MGYKQIGGRVMAQTRIDYALYDGRYYTDPDRAVVYAYCATLKEALDERASYGDDTVVVECESVPFKKGWKIVNEKIIES